MKKGDICIVNLAVGRSREQVGRRPAVLISETETTIAVVVPLTANLEALRFPYTLMITPDKDNNLEQRSVALFFHIRAIDKSRISSIIGRLNDRTIRKFNQILRGLLKI